MKKSARTESALRGERYYIGKPCKKNHEPIRYVANGMCKVCSCKRPKK